MNKVMMRKQLTGSATRALAGFKRRIETGESIDTDSALDTSLVVVAG
ncbi:MAG: hypothetical protein IIC71_01480 [Acidobacteria bacterium]|nr:hypothetical protein [Acidobacteriota bacterium]